jgi:hypothetical protein
MKLCTLQEERDPESFSTFKERLRYLQVSIYLSLAFPCTLYICSLDLINFFLFQKTEHSRVCFGHSGIHRWGLFARRDIQEGEMVPPQTLLYAIEIFFRTRLHLKFRCARLHDMV